VKHPKPDNVSDQEWHAIKKSIQIITEHIPNLALFMNWVSEEGETEHAFILEGNAFALENQINKWCDGDFDPVESDKDEDDDRPKDYK
jgi:hypothetical protein